MLHFENDYLCGCHPDVMDALVRTNMECSSGYGLDEYTEEAKCYIRRECESPNAGVWFLVGGTQTNSTVISAILRRYEGIITAESGHIAVHESGAIEAWGNKVIVLPEHNGKLDSKELSFYLKSFYADSTYPHMVLPKAVYISYPTEYGSLYSLDELKSIKEVCEQYKMLLFLDGARLGYGLMSESCDVTMKDIAEICDLFYIGGTKIGAMFGEAVVASNPDLLPHFFTTIKQHGALLAKGRLLGVQFMTLFKDGLYYKISKHAINEALRLKQAFKAKGYKIYADSPTNQQFVVLPNRLIDKLKENVSFEIWGSRGEKESVVRFVTSWSTRAEDVDKLITLIPNSV